MSSRLPRSQLAVLLAGSRQQAGRYTLTIISTVTTITITTICITDITIVITMYVAERVAQRKKAHTAWTNDILSHLETQEVFPN